jgi:ATP-dependent helicase/nuclease subunit B
MAARPRIFNIPPSAPFLRTLISALIDGRLVPGFPDRGDPLSLARATVYLPTRRACRLAHSLFLDATGLEAAVLPRLAPIGDVDEDELVFADAAGPPAALDLLELPDALDGIDRRLLLARLILAWTESKYVRGDGTPLVASGPPAALALADDLARLIDDMTTRGVPWSKLDGLVPANVDVYWRLTLEFLKVAREGWPAILAERGAIEAASRRDRLIAAAAERLKAQRDGPVIAAGSTASMPATAMLLETIARLPHGAVVLPGLDVHLDQPSWLLIGGSEGGEGRATSPAVVHPQFAMQRFLARVNVQREEVESLAPASPDGRDRLVSEALRPTAATHLWNDRFPPAQAAVALANVAVIEAASAEEEALAIAVALRETIETSGKTAALVTPDRALARRVIAALARWRVSVDDSGGNALTDTPAGAFAALAAEAAVGGLEPVPLLALLKHPQFSLGGAGGTHGRAVSALERAVLRGPRPRLGSAGLAHALETLSNTRDTLHRADPRARLTDSDLGSASALVRALTAAFGPLEGLGTKPMPLAELAKRHRAVLTALTGFDTASLVAVAEDIAEIYALLDAIAESDAAATFGVTPAEYPEILQAAITGKVVRQRPDYGARVRIFGLLEARLQPIDRVVLGGLVEGVWPPQTRSDPWLSRPMRQQLGLDLPERRIGLTAHDFAQALGAPEVVLSHAAKLAGAPTVPSRFVQRLAAVAGKGAWRDACQRGEVYLRWARSLDAVVHDAPLRAPAPKPPREARPMRLSVTEIEHLLRDPYTIYAKHVLRLAPLDPVDTPPGPRDRGSAVHEAIERFSKAYVQALPEQPLDSLLTIGRDAFKPLEDYPEARAFWWPRFARIAAWFARWDAARRTNVAMLNVEVPGEIEIPTDAGPFRLTVRADRIERLRDGRYALLDFKTGATPSVKQVQAGLAPQLTLEAAILRQGGFAGIAAGSTVSELGYVALRGRQEGGEFCPIAFKDSSADAEADKAYRELCQVIARFAKADEPYRSLVHPMWSTRYGDYDHLARVKEWSQTGGESDGEGDA